MIDLSCVPCRAKKELLNQQYIFLTEKTKERARDEQRNYAIYFDGEDEKFRAILLDEVQARNIDKYEIITKY